MKGALLVLALMVTRELTFKTHEGRKESLDGPADPCSLPSHCILPSPVQATSGADSEGRWQISAQESCTNFLRLTVFEWGWWCGPGRVIICANPGG